MIAVLALAGAVTTVSSAISAAIQAGKDFKSIIPLAGKLATLESEIAICEQGKHKSFLGRLGSDTEEAFAITNAKAQHKQAMDELRSVCMLYGPHGFWDNFQREIIAVRKRTLQRLQREADARDAMVFRITLIVGTILFAGGIYTMIYLANKLAGK